MIKKIITFFLTITSFNLNSIGAFVHPGVLVNRQQLDFMKSQVLAGVEPFASTYEKAKASKYGSLSYTPLGPPKGGTITCGSYSKPNIGCTDENSDSEAALTQSLLWYISGNSQYSTNAIKIMDTYANKLTGGHTDSNGPLQAGWATQKFPAAAEIIYYSGAGWPESSFKAFQKCLKTQYLPSLQVSKLSDNGNWGMSIVSGAMGISVVLEDQQLFDHTLEQLKDIIPAYFYNYKEDGTKPKTSPLISPKWNGQKVFDSTTSGICQETCRDFQHMQFGLASCFLGLETAYIQGKDLYPSFSNRLTTAMEYNTKFIPVGFSDLGGKKIKVDKSVCGGKIDVVANPTFEIAYNAYHTRMGISLPNTLTYLQNTVRKIEYTGGKAALDHTSTFETLHHANSSNKIILEDIYIEEIEEKEL